MATLSPSQLTAFTTLYDFRTQFVQAAVKILAAGGVTAYGPGQGIEKVGQYFVSVDFQRGAFIDGSTSPLELDLGYGANRSRAYREFTGILSIMNSVPFERDATTGEAYLALAHIRTLDELCAKQLALFMECLNPFDSTNLARLDVLELRPIEPDERPVDQREVNASFTRFFIRATIRPSAWPTS